jgi:1,4-alpha-glucan branching enzyme
MQGGWCAIAIVAGMVAGAASAVVLPVSSRAGIGATPYTAGTAKGVTFRVWAPNAQAVSVVGSFNFWSNTAHQLSSEGNGYWSGDVANCPFSAQYKFAIRINGSYQQKQDPRSRQLVNSVGNSIVYDPAAYSWSTGAFQIAPSNELVIYQLHIGSFHVPSGTSVPSNFSRAIQKLDDLVDLGVNCVELLPVSEFPGDLSWGYNPSYPFSVESAYGGPTALKQFVDACHARGLAVLGDVVHNHWGPTDLSMWQFDGWSQNSGGGIYFFQDSLRANTPWGPRPDYTRTEVQAYIRDNALQWLDEYRMDGLRWDATKFIRKTDSGGTDIPSGWSLLQATNNDVNARFPDKLIIAEDFDDNDWVTRATAGGGAGFDSQWDWFVHSIRGVVTATSDGSRDMNTVRDAVTHAYNGSAMQRVIYTESHDEVATGNGKLRLPSAISAASPGGLQARKRSTLAAAVAFTSPGIPMIFMGQEMLEDGGWDDEDPLDWSKATSQAGTRQMYKDMIALRRNTGGLTAGLTGLNTNVHHVNNANKQIAWHRWKDGGERDDVIVLANFSGWPVNNYRIGLPRSGVWKCRFNSDSSAYATDYSNTPALDVDANGPAWDGMAQSGTFRVGAYAMVVYSQGDPAPANPADLDGNCVVDAGDVSFVLLDFGSIGGPSDLDGDGVVGSGDVALLLLDFGWTCE